MLASWSGANTQNDISFHLFKIQSLSAVPYVPKSVFVPNNGWFLYGQGSAISEQLITIDGPWISGPSQFQNKVDRYSCIIQVNVLSEVSIGLFCRRGHLLMSQTVPKTS